MSARGGGRSATFVGGLALGLAAGWTLAQRRLEAHRRDLFSPFPIRRHAALGFLAGRSDVETVRLLRDFLAWERQPLLRRRAETILRRLEAELV
ncbi:MAG TPA: hypothetical protein VFS40_08700 [Gemmatimonadales bacterium]|nr:hypothetical protein [Gemmatimonadales bacterium]